MKKSFKDIISKSVLELEKEVNSLNDEIIKMKIESVSNPQKDTNLVSKKRQKLAIVLTALNQKKEAEAFKNTK